MEKWIGKNVIRREGPDKAMGKARYVDDLRFPDMLYGATVRSPVARGRIKGIRFTGNIPWNEFTIVTAKDIPGKNVVALIVDDQPFLADAFVNHPEEAVVLLAHQDKYLLEEARRMVELDIEPLPAVLTIDEAIAKKAIVWGKDNIHKELRIIKGDVDAAFKTAAKVVEGEYFTGAQEQLYIETNGMISVASPQDGVTVWGSLQCPYYVQKALRSLFALGNDKIRVVQTETGGGFGGKEDYPSMIAGHAALLAWKSKKPVKIIYDREEDMAATTKRHPSRTRIKTALDTSGRITAIDIDFVVDGGAYVTLSPVVLSRGSIHAAGPYEFANVRVRGRSVATNTPPHGAFRGFGAPQSLFAIEKHMEHVANELGCDAVEFRNKHFLTQGKVTATGQTLGEKVMMHELMHKALEKIDYAKRREKFKAENKRPGNTVKRGLGIAAFMHGSGFTGAGEKYLASVAGVEGTDEGRVRVLAASTEIGQGTNTVFSQIVAEALGLPIEMIEVARPDTHVVPDSGPTVASRTCMVVGKLVESAAIGLKQTLVQGRYLNANYTPLEFAEAVKSYVKKVGQLKAFSEYRQPSHIVWDENLYKGDAYTTYAWAVYVAQVAVDTVTFETTVEDFVGFQEIGKVVNPILAEGQIEGGIAQGIGYALYEKVVWRDGRMANNQMTNYIMPTSMDLPPIRVFFEEVPYFNGPAGAKGIGELPIDGPAPAILNAIEDAFDGKVTVNEIPLTPEVLMASFARST